MFNMQGLFKKYQNKKINVYQTLTKVGREVWIPLLGMSNIFPFILDIELCAQSLILVTLQF